MRIHFIVNRRAVPEPSAVLLDVYRRLRERGVLVDESIPEECLVNLQTLANQHDLYVLKSHTELALSLAGGLDALGGRILNPYRSCLRTQDKITAAALLAHAGVPVPDSWITADYGSLMPLLGGGPLIAKPHRGHWGQGITILRSAGDVESLDARMGPYLVQRYLRAEEEELKAYVVGQHVSAVVKRFSETSFQDAGEPVDLDAPTRDIILSCGAALGLHLYGVDLVTTDAGPYVVDVNYFPGYKGVPGAAGFLSDHIYKFATTGRGADGP
jgi:ribosomal protein S6--L-glutamate ligase